MDHTCLALRFRIKRQYMTSAYLNQWNKLLNSFILTCQCGGIWDQMLHYSAFGWMEHSKLLNQKGKCSLFKIIILSYKYTNQVIKILPSLRDNLSLYNSQGKFGTTLLNTSDNTWQWPTEEETSHIGEKSIWEKPALYLQLGNRIPDGLGYSNCPLE